MTAYRRFIQMYGDVVLGVEHAEFEDLLEAHKDVKGVSLDTELDADDLKALVDEYKGLVEEALGEPFPQDPKDQLWGAVSAVFGSWQTARAVTYRQLHDIPEDWGTAVNVQAMVFGNMGDDCATGVAFTRDPSTGENTFYGEYLVNAQGEDVVAGIRTPQQLTVAGWTPGSRLPSMEETMPEVFGQLDDIREKLEQHYKDMQDIEFTVQKGRLYMLQTRAGKRTTAAAIRIAVEMEKEGLIDKAQAVCRVEPAALDQLLHPRLDPDAGRDVIPRPAGVAGSGFGPGVFQRGRGRGRRFAGREGNPGAGRDQPRGHSRHARRQGHPHRARRHDQPRRGGGARHGAALRCRCGRAPDRLCGERRCLSATRRLRPERQCTIDGAAGEVIRGEVRRSSQSYQATSQR